jgi:hypothetical protein
MIVVLPDELKLTNTTENYISIKKYLNNINN